MQQQPRSRRRVRPPSTLAPREEGDHHRPAGAASGASANTPSLLQRAHLPPVPSTLLIPLAARARGARYFPWLDCRYAFRSPAACPGASTRIHAGAWPVSCPTMAACRGGRRRAPCSTSWRSRRGTGRASVYRRTMALVPW